MLSILVYVSFILTIHKNGKICYSNTSIGGAAIFWENEWSMATLSGDTDPEYMIGSVL